MSSKSTWSTQNTNCSVTMKFIDTERKTSHTITVQAANPQQLRQRMLETEAECVGEWGWIADQWPFVKDADKRLNGEPGIDIYQEFGIPATAEGLTAFIATDAFTELPQTVRETITADLHTFLQNGQPAPAPARQATAQQASLSLYGPNLDNLFDAQGFPLMSLPPGAGDPGFRPARWCAIHQRWMNENTDQRGGRWFSHPSEDRYTGYCKGRPVKEKTG